MVKIVKKIVIINLKGGFGNQIFQLSFAKFLADKKLKVLINTSNFEDSKKLPNIVPDLRELILPVSYFGFKEINSLIYGILKLLLFIGLSNNSIFKKLNDKNFDITNLAKINFLDGYWQDAELLMQNKEYIINSICNNENLRTALNTNPIAGSTLLHVRRGDYINISETLSDSFYKNALLKARSEINNFTYSIVTDDYDWVKNNDLFADCKEIHHSSNSREDTVLAFSEMLRFENFIIGNSTFSLIAGIIRSKASSKLYIANPWFRKNKKVLNVKNAIKIDNV